MTWADYYDRAFDCKESTLLRRLSQLQDFGPSQEILEVVETLSPQGAGRLLGKALAAGVRFAPEEVLELALLADRPLLEQLALTARTPFDADQLLELWGSVGEDVYRTLTRRSGVDPLQEDEEPVEDEPLWESPPPKPASGGLWLALATLFGSSRSGRHSHTGPCDGDCAHCPDHYGYRYGRWYYGKGHTHGCEFGGNGGA